MKVLIWIGCFIVATILNILLGYTTGFKAGYFVFYIAVSFTAKALCKQWDKHKANKAANQAQEAIVNNKKPTYKDRADNENSAHYCWNCGEKLIEESRFCRKCGEKVFEASDSFKSKE